MHKRNGFTVIEILIVLAIAGLIMLIVFLAVPSLQRSSRNTGRHKDISLLLAAVLDAKSATGTGALPESCDNTQSGCLAKDTGLSQYDNKSSAAIVKYWKLNDPYSNAVEHLTPETEDVTGKVMIYTYAICNEAGTEATGQYASPQSVVAVYAIETFGGPALQCESI